MKVQTTIQYENDGEMYGNMQNAQKLREKRNYRNKLKIYKHIESMEGTKNIESSGQYGGWTAC